MSPTVATPPALNTMRLEIEGEIGTLVLNRPESFNAMNPEMIFELPTVFSWLADCAGAVASA